MDLNTRKVELNVAKVKLELNLKKTQFVIKPMQVSLAVDRSGSMSEQYRSGWVDSVINVAAAAAIRFDVDKSLPIVFFDDALLVKDPIVESMVQAGSYLQRNPDVRVDGSTRFTQVVNYFKSLGMPGFFESIFGGRKAAVKYPELVMFITDGHNDHDDRDDFLRAIRSTAETNFFYMFIATNSSSRAYLEGYLPKQNNLAVINVTDSFNDGEAFVDDFYTKIFSQPQFKTWIARF